MNPLEGIIKGKKPKGVCLAPTSSEELTLSNHQKQQTPPMCPMSLKCQGSRVILRKDSRIGPSPEGHQLDCLTDEFSREQRSRPRKGLWWDSTGGSKEDTTIIAAFFISVWTVTVGGKKGFLIYDQ